MAILNLGTTIGNYPALHQGAPIISTSTSASSLAGPLTVAGGDLTLSHGTANLLNFGTNGKAGPTFSTRSAGTKISLHANTMNATTAEHAIGIENTDMWFGVPTTSTYGFKFYGGITLAASLSGTGLLDAKGGYKSNGNDVISSTGAWTGSTITAEKGGTGYTTYTTGDLLYASNGTTLTKLNVGAAKTVLVGGTTPSYATLDLTYVQDSWVKKVVKGATSANLTANYAANVLTATGNGAFSLADGVTYNLNDRILVKDQGTKGHNGIYALTQLGNGSLPWKLTRVAGAETAAEIAGAMVIVDEGPLGGQTWRTSFKSGSNLGVTDMNWYQVLDTSGVGTLTALTVGGNITLTNGAGRTIGVAPAASGQSGLELSIKGSDAVNLSGNNLGGGNISLYSGRSTGTGTSRILFYTPDVSSTSGSGGNSHNLRGWVSTEGLDLLTPIRMMYSDSQRLRYKFILGRDGKLEWGAGTADNDADTNLYRSTVGVLKTDGDLQVAGDISEGGTKLSAKYRPQSEVVAFSALKTSAQNNQPAGDSKVTFATEEFDHGNCFASSTFTAPTTGLYLISTRLTVFINTAAVGTRVSFYIRVNGVNVVNFGAIVIDGNTQYVNTTEHMKLNKDDTVEIWFNSSASGISIVSSSAGGRSGSFGVHRLA